MSSGSLRGRSTSFATVEPSSKSSVTRAVGGRSARVGHGQERVGVCAAADLPFRDPQSVAVRRPGAMMRFLPCRRGWRSPAQRALRRELDAVCRLETHG